MNEREIKQRASEVRDLQREHEHGAGELIGFSPNVCGNSRKLL
jgi:hypothetical protein